MTELIVWVAQAIMIALIITLIVCALVAIWKLPAGRGTASLQIELCRLKAKATIESRRLERLNEAVAKYSALHALGSELMPHEYNELRIAYNELYVTGSQSNSSGPDLDIAAPQLDRSDS